MLAARTLAALTLSASLIAGCATHPDTDRADPISVALTSPSPVMSQVLAAPHDYRLQIILSELTPASGGRTIVRTSSFRAGREYFYPASTIKLLAAIAACELFDEIDSRRTPNDVRELAAIDAPLSFAPIFEGQSVYSRDDSNLADQSVTLHHQLRKLFLVSDNPAYNRLYELLGQDDLNQRSLRAGLSSVRLSHRLSEGRTPEQNRLTPRVDISLPEGVLSLPERRGSLDLAVPDMPGLSVGSAYMRGSSVRVDTPMHFADKSAVSLLDLHRALILLARPDADLGLPGFRLSQMTRESLLSVMREYPANSENPRYDRATYPDDYTKFFLPGLTRVVPQAELRIANKVGQAYGFTIDNALVEHIPTSRAFVLSCVLYTNADGVLNDNAYEYDEIAFPFLADLAERVASTLWIEPRSSPQK
jgi:Beta-lactamase enzyme family